MAKYRASERGARMCCIKSVHALKRRIGQLVENTWAIMILDSEIELKTKNMITSYCHEIRHRGLGATKSIVAKLFW